MVLKQTQPPQRVEMARHQPAGKSHNMTSSSWTLRIKSQFKVIDHVGNRIIYIVYQYRLIWHKTQLYDVKKKKNLWHPDVFILLFGCVCMEFVRCGELKVWKKCRLQIGSRIENQIKFLNNWWKKLKLLEIVGCISNRKRSGLTLINIRTHYSWILNETSMW